MSKQHRKVAENDAAEHWVPEASSSTLDGHIEGLGKQQPTSERYVGEQIV
jgi:hypothetical protein